jgi:hypothetical protein
MVNIPLFIIGWKTMLGAGFRNHPPYLQAPVGPAGLPWLRCARDPGPEEKRRNGDADIMVILYGDIMEIYYDIMLNW